MIITIKFPRVFLVHVVCTVQGPPWPSSTSAVSPAAWRADKRFPSCNKVMCVGGGDERWGEAYKVKERGWKAENCVRTNISWASGGRERPPSQVPPAPSLGCPGEHTAPNGLESCHFRGSQICPRSSRKEEKPTKEWERSVSVLPRNLKEYTSILAFLTAGSGRAGGEDLTRVTVGGWGGHVTTGVPQTAPW